MDLIVFDLDGTLLNGKSEVSAHTQATLRQLRERGIAYTVATGRTLHASMDLLSGHGFTLPHIYKNGVVIWQPERQGYSHSQLLTLDEIGDILGAYHAVDVTPFIFTLGRDEHHAVYHSPLKNKAEHRLAEVFAKDRGLDVLPVSELPGDLDITNISALGERSAIEAVQEQVTDAPHLIAYGGVAFEGDDLYWLDVHHSAATKGSAVSVLKQELGISRVICFGDSDNDLPMFDVADECYAPSNAKEPVKAAATAVIGHHDEDGISRFLRDRFDLV